jgi:hypothetical protein
MKAIPLIYLTLPAYPYPAALDRLRTLEAGCLERYPAFAFVRAIGHTLYDRPEFGQAPTMEQLLENARRRIVGDLAGALNGYFKPAGLWHFGSAEQQVTDEIGWAREVGLLVQSIPEAEEEQLHRLGILHQHRSLGLVRKQAEVDGTRDRTLPGRADALLHAYFEGMGPTLDIQGTDYGAVHVGAQFGAHQHLERCGLFFAMVCGVLRLAFKRGLTDRHLLVLRALMQEGRGYLKAGEYLGLRRREGEPNETLVSRVRKLEADGKALVQVALVEKQAAARKAEKEGEAA